MRKNRIIRNCLICNKQFETIPSRARRNQDKYCSRKCYGKSKLGYSPWNKGKLCSEEHKKKIGLANKGKKRTEEAKKKYSQAFKGHFVSQETRNKIRDRLKGRVFSKEWLDKMSKAKIGKYVGKKHWGWKGGYECRLMNNKKRRIKKLGNGGSHTLSEWLTLKAQYNWTCPCCGKREPFIGQRSLHLTEDHIIPLSKGGSDNIENIQPLCWKCNCKKHTKIIKYENVV